MTAAGAAVRLAVWGDPIAHSRSPELHAAAYRVLGLDWSYGRERVAVDGFDAALDRLDGSWRGLSLTMPLKERAFALADAVDDDARLTGAVNTYLLGSSVQGFNTDVGGLTAALADAGLGAVRTARVLGGGATARSALVSLLRLGTVEVELRTRRSAQADELAAFARRIGLRASAAALDVDGPLSAVDLTASTLPGSAELPGGVTAALAAAGGALFSAAYAPWPTPLATAWRNAPVVTGLEMLLHQAVRQIRIFRNGAPDRELPDEAAVLRAMRAALDAPPV
ncbi:shikimate dehydrogenase [uncultured Microbacterium sp.]|uniref:shikimate dehydrogenase n=1 Tax=uncultured Microbacterium sp. TaxID=191216 RepID=UPI0025E2DF2E|nr:shikimate dehydrogenase [uncultured Microbacterium sp.]